MPTVDELALPMVSSAFLAFILVYFHVMDILNGRAVRHLNNGDPEKLFEIMSLCLKRSMDERRRFVFSSNYAAALLEMGRPQEAFDVLYSIKGSKYLAKHHFGFAFYNNMVRACEELGDFAQADRWYGLMVDYYNSLKSNSFKSWSTIPMRFAEVNFDYRHGNFDLAMKKLNEIRPICLIQDVHKAHLTADIALALGQRDYAISALRYVVAKGNKLYIVQKCRQKLMGLESEQP